MPDDSVGPVVQEDKTAWPSRITLRDTKVHADEGQRIYTTATGYGYEKRDYVRADLAPHMDGPADDLVARLLKRAEEDERCVENSEAVVAAFADEMRRFEARTGHNVYAVRLAVDHANAAKKNRRYASDLREAAARLAILPLKAKRGQ